MISLKKMPQVSFLLLSECNSKKERGHVVGGAPPHTPPLSWDYPERAGHTCRLLGSPPPHTYPTIGMGALMGQRSGQEGGKGRSI